MRKRSDQVAREFVYLQTYGKKIIEEKEPSSMKKKPSISACNHKQRLSGGTIHLTEGERQLNGLQSDILLFLTVLFQYSLGLLRREASNPFNDHRGIPSPRCLFATRAYACLPDENGNWNKVYAYDPLSHSLVLQATSKNGIPLEETVGIGLEQVDLAIAVSSDYEVFPDSYGEFKYSLGMLEVGHFLETAEQLGESLGYRCHISYFFLDEALSDLIGCTDPAKETPLSVLLFSKQSGAYRYPTVICRARDHRWIDCGQNSLYAAFHEASIVRKWEELTRFNQSEQTTPQMSAVRKIERPQEAIFRRNAGRGVFGLSAHPGEIPQENLIWVAQNAFAPYSSDTNSLEAGWLKRIEPYVAVHRVAGLDSGLYKWDSADRRLILVKPGNALPEIQQSFTYPPTSVNLLTCNLIWLLAADYPDMIVRYGARGFRVMQLELGKIAQRIGLYSSERNLFSRPVRSFREYSLEGLLNLLDSPKTVGYQILCGQNRCHDLIFDLRGEEEQNE
ncbi:hypothetical protein ACE3MS_04575 [Paenibacillus dendritiformis]|uniref:hypothetical protein n=1 Tax=Paenibacillus dendritiformis TaxID=130049 RepID=UPI00366379B1